MRLRLSTFHNGSASDRRSLQWGRSQRRPCMPVITFATLPDDPLGNAGTFAQGINGLGQIVGFYLTSSPSNHGFLYTSGDYTTIDDPLGTAGSFALTPPSTIPWA